MIILSLFFVITVSNPVYAQREVPFTMDDRDRLIRVEEGLVVVHQRIDSLKKRIDALYNFNLMYVLIGAVIAQTVGVIGFVLWDRRSALSPAITKINDLERRVEILEKTVKIG